MEKKINLHKDHRQRLKKRFNTEGHLSFEEHNMLELILFYGIPYKDTNPISHELISTFGSLENVLKADKESLTRISGVGTYTAEFLNCFYRAVYFLENKGFFRSKRVPSYRSIAKMGEYLKTVVANEKSPSTFVVLLNNRYEILSTRRLLSTSSGIHLIKLEELMSLFIEHNASMAVIVQHKYGGLAVPGFEDICSVLKLKSALETSEFKLIEMFAVTADDYTPVFVKSKNMIQRPYFPENVLSVAAQDGYELQSEQTGDIYCDSEDEDKEAPNYREEELSLLAEILGYAKRGGAEELSERLLDRFGSMRKLLYTELERLCELDGVNENIATLIRLISATRQYISDSNPPKSLSLSDRDGLVRYITELYFGQTSESTILLMFDKNKKYISHKRLSSGGINAVMISGRGILENSVRERAEYVVLTHNHPNGLPLPSFSDREATIRIGSSLERLGITLDAHYIVAEGECEECQV